LQDVVIDLAEVRLGYGELLWRATQSSPYSIRLSHVRWWAQGVRRTVSVSCTATKNA